MESCPWISVLIPTFNGEAYLEQALKSIEAQGRHSVECLVADDGSQDKTLQIIESFKKRLQIKLLPVQPAGNWTLGVNRALEVARGEFISILHQDDLWSEGRLQTLKQMTEAYPKAVMYLHASYFMNAEGKRIGLWRCPLNEFKGVIPSQEMVERLLVQNFISIPAPLIRRAAAVKAGGLDPNLKYTADWDFWLKVASQGETSYNDIPLSGFRIHAGAQTVQYSGNPEYFNKQLNEVFERHFKVWDGQESLKTEVEKAARFSIQANVILGQALHGSKLKLLKLILPFLSLGPSGWHRYLRDSRISERLGARLNYL